MKLKSFGFGLPRDLEGQRHERERGRAVNFFVYATPSMQFGDGWHLFNRPDEECTQQGMIIFDFT